MKTGVIDFRTTNAFPGFVVYVCVIIIILGMLALTANWIAGVVVIFFGVVGVTTQQRLMIDFDRKVYRYYVRLLGFKIGDVERFNTIEYIFIKTNKVSQKVNNLAGAYQSRSISKIHFDAFLRFSEHDKIHIAGEESKKNVLKFVAPIAKKLGVEVLDYTVDQPQ